MDARTEAHLRKAEHLRQIAHDLSARSASGPSGLPPHDWAVAAAFYAAVHYVNAYLWERQRLDPGSHRGRSGLMWSVPVLRPAAGAYSTLERLGWKYRYDPVFQLRPRDVLHVVQVELEDVRRVVRGALGLTS